MKKDTFPGIAGFDVMMVLFLAVAVLLRLSILAINVEAGEGHIARMKNDKIYDIKLQWPGASDADLDLYVMDPQKHFVFFRRTDDGGLSLDRDDTGAQSNTVVLPDGRQVTAALNEENVSVRTLYPGEYIVNVHVYNKDKNSKDAIVPAQVSLWRMSDNGDMEVHSVTLQFDHKGQEATAFRFTLTAAGDPVDINQLDYKFVGDVNREVLGHKHDAAPSTTPETEDPPNQ